MDAVRLIIAQIGNNKTVTYATKEIVRLVRAMDRTICLDIRRYDRKSDDLPQALWIGIDGSVPASKYDDAIVIDVKNGAGIITGSNERSVLIAAYRFMTELGCRFLHPGRDGEKIPTKKLSEADLTITVNEKPSYRHRGIMIEGSVSVEHVCNTIEWLPKVGMNSYYSQFFVPTVFFKRYYGEHLTDDDVDAMMPLIEEEVEKRGLIYHAIGHGWTCAPFGFLATGWEGYEGEIDQELINVLALYKGEKKFFGKRPLCTQLCYSYPSVKETVADFAVEYMKQHPNIDYLHMSMGDSGRNHCECEECMKKRPSDHLVDLLNILDDKLTEAGLDTKLSFDVYADTLFAPVKEKLHDNDRFCMNFAPIARSFAHSYADVDLDNLPETAPFIHNQDMKRDTVELNIAYLKKWQENYKGDAYVIDYQLIWNHHVDQGYYHVAELINKDMLHLGRMGLNGMVSCQVMRAAFPTGLPQYMMAKNLWNKELSFEEVKDEYYNCVFGEHAKLVEDYARKLSDLTHLRFVIGQVKLAPEEVVERYTLMKETAIKFREEHLEALKDKSTQWEYLYIHSFFVTNFADIFISRYSGDEEAVEKYCAQFREKLEQYKPVIEDVCDDVGISFSVIDRYLKRHPPIEKE